MFAAMFAGLHWSLTGGNESVCVLLEIREKNTYPKNERQSLEMIQRGGQNLWNV